MSEKTESPKSQASEKAEVKEDVGPSHEERVAMGESAKEAGNALLKAGKAMI